MPARFVVPVDPYSQAIPYSTSADENTLSRKYFTVASRVARSRRTQVQKHVGRNAHQLQCQKQHDQIVRRRDEIRPRQIASRQACASAEWASSI